MKNECCGNCRFHKQKDEADWICTCEDSEAYALETNYDDCCIDYKERSQAWPPR